MASFFTSLFGAPGAPGNNNISSSSSNSNNAPIEVTSEAQFRSLTGSGVAAVDFHAQWCGPCKAVAPVFARLAASYPTIKFLKVDVDALGGVSAGFGVSAMPTFVVLRDGKTVGTVVGADMGALESLLRAHAPPPSFSGSGRTLAGSGGGSGGGGGGGESGTTSTTTASSSSSSPSSLDHKDFKEGQPSIKLVLRLADGSRATARFAQGATVADLEELVSSRKGSGGKTPASMTAGFPPQRLSDASAALAPFDGSVVTCSNRP